MRLLWLLPLLMAAVTFALPRRHQPDKNPTIPILGTAAVAGSAAAVAVEALGEGKQDMLLSFLGLTGRPPIAHDDPSRKEDVWRDGERMDRK